MATDLTIPEAMSVIDADGHVMETQDVWDNYMEEAFWPQRPKLIQLHENSDWFYIWGLGFQPDPLPVNGTYPLGFGTLGLTHAGRGTGDPNPPMRIDVGATDPHSRIKDMDIEGRDVDVLYPSVLLACNVPSLRPNLNLAAAICRAYNNWLADFCKSYPERLKGIAVVNLMDVEEAVKEVNRCVTKLGFIGVMITPYVVEKNLDDPALYPFYEEVQRLGVPIGIHINFQTSPAKLERIVHSDYGLCHALVAIPHIIALGQLIFGGVLDRFPKLRVALLETGVGWVPYWIDRFDAKYKATYACTSGKPYLSRLPSEFIKSEQLFFSCDPDEQTLPYAVEVVGEDRILYASDYPHHDARFPESVRDISNHQKLSASAKRKILGENAAKLYGLTRSVSQAGAPAH